MRKNQDVRGFTLIELLVVIAIIGLLASVVLASLNTARSRGGDASIKSNMASIQVQAQIFYDGANPNAYSTSGAENGTTVASCNEGIFTDPNILQAMTAIDAANGTIAMRCTIDATAQMYLFASPLPGGNFWCIDYRGVKVQVAADPGAVYVCN